jgi:CRISPR/Cas system-associated exonuclease Cas4 (RecB family)
MHDRPHWSYSAVSQYMACPLQYFFQRIIGLPRITVSSKLVLGSAVHHALAEYHRTILYDEPTRTEALHRVFIKAWEQREAESRVTYRSRESRAEVIAQGIALIEVYLLEPPPQRIVGIEQEIIAPLHNSQGEILETPLIAVADLLTEGDEELVVHEFKTSGRTYSEMEVDTSLQATCYVNAVQEVHGYPPKVEFTVLVKTRKPKVQRLTTVRTDEDLGRLGDVVQAVERAIQAGIFYPVESPLNCSSCPYRLPCRDWGRPGLTQQLVVPGTTEGEAT